jgi:hypothetical protein
MKFDSSIHKCTIVIDKDLPSGLAMNASSVIGISFGKCIDNIVGPNMKSKDDVNYPGVIYSPLPVLLGSGSYLLDLQSIAEKNEDIFVMPFSSLAQSCRTYDEYDKKLSAEESQHIELAGIGLVGPKKIITKLTGNLPLFK